MKVERLRTPVIVESKEIASPCANPLCEALTLTICETFGSEFWCQTMRPVAETMTTAIMKRFQIILKKQP
jgi:hypothetical protein